MVTKKFICLQCKTQVSCQGNPGDHLLVECAKCGQKGTLVFHTKKPEVKRTGNSIEVKIEKNKIFSSAIHSNQSISIIAFLKGGMGIYSTTIYNQRDIEKAVELVSSIVYSAHPDPDFKSLPYPSQYPRVEGLFDQRIASVEKEKIFGWATNAIKEALALEPNILISGEITSGSGEWFLANTNGIEAGEKTTHISMSLFGVIRSGDDTGSAFDFDEAKRHYSHGAALKIRKLD